MPNSIWVIYNESLLTFVVLYYNNSKLLVTDTAQLYGGPPEIQSSLVLPQATVTTGRYRVTTTQTFQLAYLITYRHISHILHVIEFNMS